LKEKCCNKLEEKRRRASNKKKSKAARDVLMQMGGGGGKIYNFSICMHINHNFREGEEEDSEERKKMTRSASDCVDGDFSERLDSSRAFAEGRHEYICDARTWNHLISSAVDGDEDGEKEAASDVKKLENFS
jgi:hypothetical protein